MKKGFFGYNVSEVNVMMNALREENESLNATITTLKTQIKNSEIGGAKANLLEANLKSIEENLRQLSAEKNELISQITALSSESEALKHQNTELLTQIKHYHMQNEDLNRQIIVLRQQITELTDENNKADNSFQENLQTQLNSEKKYKTVLEQILKDKAEELTAATDELAITKTALETATIELEETREKARELEYAQKEIKQLQEELAIAMIAVDEQDKIKAMDKKQLANMNQASEISFRAYYEMLKMRNEVIEYIHEQLKEYYQFVNENSVKMRTAIEQRQLEYNQMIRDFFTKASEFRVSLSSIEDKYSNMADYSMNIDRISNNMNEIMNNFIEETDAYFKKKEDKASPNIGPATAEKNSNSPVEDAAIKPFMFKIS
jgi:chromosome segregation ATPase